MSLHSGSKRAFSSSFCFFSSSVSSRSWPSFMRAMYSLREIWSSPLLEVWKRRRSAILVLLKGLTGDVEGQVLRVDNTLDEGKPVWNNFLAVVHDENTSDIKLNVVPH